MNPLNGFIRVWALVCMPIMLIGAMVKIVIMAFRAGQEVADELILGNQESEL